MAATRAVPLSDMNGQGDFWIGRAWFQLYWLVFALMLGIIAFALWRRGVTTSLEPRLRRLGRRLSGAPGVTLAIAAIGWIAIGGWIYYNTNVLNDYRTQRDEEKLTAEYEKALLQFETVPQPRITDIRLAVDIYPNDVRVVTDGVYAIESIETAAPLPSVHVRWARPLKMRSLEIDGAKLEKEYKEFDYRT